MTKKNTLSHYEHLSKKWAKRHKKIKKQLFKKHKDSLEWISNNAKQIALTGATSIMLLNPTPPATSQPHALITQDQIARSPQGTDLEEKIDKTAFLLSDLEQIVPKEVRILTNEEENKISQTLSQHFGLLHIAPMLEGIKLNRSYGLIGAEQHLARFPGDNMSIHFDTQEEAVLYYSSGMAPGLGAGRYFTDSASHMTEEDKLREKYYIAVQTFLAPGFHENVKKYMDFFIYRKMLVVNPENGKSIVVVIADSGPAEWTGKHLGGSPEVMKYLEREDGAKKGPVLYFFIDDPEDVVPLGPISPV